MNTEVFLDTTMCQWTRLLVFWKQLLPPFSEPNNPRVTAVIFPTMPLSLDYDTLKMDATSFSKTFVNINPHCTISLETWILQFSSYTYGMLLLQKQHHFLTIKYKTMWIILQQCSKLCKWNFSSMVSIQLCIISQNNKELISHHYLYPSSDHVQIIYAPVRYKQELHINTLKQACFLPE